MSKIFPVRLKGIWGVFDEVARARLCESSGSEHSAVENLSGDLSKLVDSFLERDERVEEVERMEKKRTEEERGGSESKSYSETKEMLMGLIGGGGAGDGDGDGGVKQRIRTETEIAWQSVGSGSSEGFKHLVMSWLRQRGLDAGLCKCRWEKTARYPAGEYEYIDVISSTAGARYIVELSTISEFTIARPTNHYASLLETFPRVVVCKEGEFKRVVRLMCDAMRESLKQRDMHVPPWRRNGYMMAKWFGSYKRTTNGAVPATTIASCPGRSLVRSETSLVLPCHCKGEVVKKAAGLWGS